MKTKNTFSVLAAVLLAALVSGCEVPKPSPAGTPKQPSRDATSIPPAKENAPSAPKPDGSPHARIVELALQEGVILARLEVESDPAKRKQLEADRHQIAKQRQAIYPEKNKP